MSNLVSDIWPSVANISVHLSHDTNVLIAIQERVLFLALYAHASRSAMESLVGLEAGM